MTDKKTFGAFIKAKRVEKNYSQKELAEQLFVTEGAISKWERGVSYPDITLISDICRALDISEHELVTASTDTDTRKREYEARKFRVIRGAWIQVPTVAYGVALLTCFICNLAVNHTLSWFFIVLAALICAYTFVPTIAWLVASKKLFAFAVSTYLSTALLLFTCAVYTGGMSWFLTACIGVLIGYTLVFVPVFLSKTKVRTYRFLITFAAIFVLTLLLLCNVRLWRPFPLDAGMLITCYAYLPVLLSAVICTFRLDGFLKAGICTILNGVAFYGTNYILSCLFETEENLYRVNFHDWTQSLSANVQAICLLSFLLIGAIFILVGILRTKIHK